MVKHVVFDHVAIGVPCMADAAPFLAGELGGVPDAGAIRTSAAFAWGTYRYEGGGSIEVLEPIGPEGFVQRFLAERGPGIHHVTFKVPSLDAVCARAEMAGYGIVGRGDSEPEWREGFLHTKQAHGYVVQFADSGPSDVTAPAALPPAVPLPPSPVTVLGLRMRCQSRERALTLWSTVLQGRITEQPLGMFRFGWPDSFMRIDVEIDPVQNEGPMAIELAPSGRTLPAGRPLGTRFREARA